MSAIFESKDLANGRVTIRNDIPDSAPSFLEYRCTAMFEQAVMSANNAGTLHELQKEETADRDGDVRRSKKLYVVNAGGHAEHLMPLIKVWLGKAPALKKEEDEKGSADAEEDLLATEPVAGLPEIKPDPHETPLEWHEIDRLVNGELGYLTSQPGVIYFVSHQTRNLKLGTVRMMFYMIGRPHWRVICTSNVSSTGAKTCTERLSVQLPPEIYRRALFELLVDLAGSLVGSALGHLDRNVRAFRQCYETRVDEEQRKSEEAAKRLCSVTMQEAEGW